MTLRSVALAATLACAAGASTAATTFGDHVRLSGFGTLGVATSDNGSDDFVRDGALKGAGTGLGWSVDSKLGLQADATATSWLSGTVQVLAEQRYQGVVEGRFEWAFVRVTPVQGLNLRLGRISPSMFMVSDSRNIGYANTMIRQPNEVYALAGLKTLKGGDISYAFDVAGTTLTVSALAGRSEFTNARVSIEAGQTRGLNLVWETDYGTLRVGKVTARPDVPLLPEPAHYAFSGIGYQYDGGRLVFAAEIVKRHDSDLPDMVDSKGWYVMAGWRFGSVLPYASYGRTTVKNPDLNMLNGAQTGQAVGVRWDVLNNAALKLQYDHVDPKDTMGVSYTPADRPPFTPQPKRDSSNVLSLAVEFVF